MGEGPTFRVMSLLDEETVEVGDDPLHWIPVRRRLGIGAFGVNAYRAAKGEIAIEDHVESPGQEELYLVLRGRAAFTVGGERLELGPCELIYLPDPSQRRVAVALADDTTVLAVGGWRDQPYHSLPWEPIFLADPALRARAWAEAVEILEREAGPQRESPFVRYRLACCLAQLGETERAMNELRAAVADRPQLRERAQADELLEPLHGHDGWRSGG